ncbi:hypothetical protein L6452_34353 [Arctium lappa]|uniref:Uncharacterized protein n=1 Tax=Arctium lappa TaxID=4217 RepID=A0ACB8YJJ5_ARCLA|nr:hypothetical protein L6452_34353 [Arctium lappa]
MSKMLIGNFWLTCVYDDETKQNSTSIFLDPTSPDITFGVDDVRRALQILSYPSYDKFPLGNEHDKVVDTLNYIHGDNDCGRGTFLRKNIGGPSSVMAPSLPSLVKPVSKKKSSKATDLIALAKMTLPPNEPSVFAQDAIENLGDPQPPSSPFSMVVEDDLDFSPVQGSAFSLHGLSSDHFMVDVYALPGETSVLPKGFNPSSASRSAESPNGSSKHSSTDDSSSSPSPTDASLNRCHVPFDDPYRILPHHPPTPTRVQDCAPKTRDPPPTATSTAFLEDLLEDIRDANRQHRMVGSQFGALKVVLASFVKATLEQLKSLQDSNHHHTISVTALKAASDARDDEVRRLQASSQSQ